MLFLPSVNFDYGEMPVMASLSLLSLSPTLWLRGVGGVEVLIGNCRAHCLHIHGFLDWPASGSETHQHKPPHTHMWYVSFALTHTQTLSQANQHFEITIFMFTWIFIRHALLLTPASGSDHTACMRKYAKDTVMHLWLTKKFLGFLSKRHTLWCTICSN